MGAASAYQGLIFFFSLFIFNKTPAPDFLACSTIASRVVNISLQANSWTNQLDLMRRTWFTELDACYTHSPTVISRVSPKSLFLWLDYSTTPDSTCAVSPSRSQTAGTSGKPVKTCSGT